MSKDYKMRGFDSFDLSAESFTHDKPVEAFSSRQITLSSCQQPALAKARSSFSSSSNEIWPCLWIKEEDNREEIASSFSGLGLYSPQLDHPTKARAKAPKTRRPRKNKSNNASVRAETEKAMNFEKARSWFRGKKPLADTRSQGKESKESTSASSTTDKVRNLRARFEQM